MSLIETPTALQDSKDLAICETKCYVCGAFSKTYVFRVDFHTPCLCKRCVGQITKQFMDYLKS